MGVIREGARVGRTDQPDWGPGTVSYISVIRPEAQVIFAGGFVIAWVPLADLEPWADAPVPQNTEEEL